MQLKSVFARTNAALTVGLIAILMAVSVYATNMSPAVQLKRVPDGGIQPQTAVGNSGTVHLVYFKGDPSGGDLFYAKSKDGRIFSSAIRVNSVPGTAIAAGNIRGPRIAVGRHDRVYIAWNGSRKAADANGGKSPMLFTRLNDAGTAFEPQRNLIRAAYGIDGGGGLAADQRGNVYVFWHAPMPRTSGEENRRVWMARSEDDGRTFALERIAWSEPTGACGCCSLNAFADTTGKVYVLFRSAQQMVHRNMYLLESNDHGNTFKGSDISDWTVGYCVMSTEAFTSDRDQVLAAWETEKKIQVGRIAPNSTTVTQVSLPDPGDNQKYPSLAANRAGLVLVAWTEGMGWKRGGSLHWQLLDKSLRPMGKPGAANGVPVWSLDSAYAMPNGGFAILY
jgi:hypothetical protein